MRSDFSVGEVVVVVTIIVGAFIKGGDNSGDGLITSRTRRTIGEVGEGALRREYMQSGGLACNVVMQSGNATGTARGSGTGTASGNLFSYNLFGGRI